MNPRSWFAELLGTAFLVFMGVGVATLSFGFKITGFSRSAGVVATALTFGLVLLVLVYAIGPISGCHINPAVTIGFLTSGRISVFDAIGYWIAQVAGGIGGAAALYGIFHWVPSYSKTKVGLGTNGYGSQSMVGLNGDGAFVVEIIITALFVLTILAVTRHRANATVAGLMIGFSLTLVHLFGIPLTGTSVNPARSLGPALMVGGIALSQVWLFIVAPLIGGIAASIVYRFLYPKGEEQATVEPAPEEQAA